MKNYSIDTTSHIDAQHNRVAIQGSFMAMQRMVASKATSIKVLRNLKEKIRARDAEPAAWFVGPSRAKWVMARMDRGEQMTHEDLGRAMVGNDREVAA